MEKNWKFRNRKYTMTKKMVNGEWQHKINDYYCSGLLWNIIDAFDEPKLMSRARLMAETFIRNNREIKK